jgi:hypothetical protein
MNRDTDKEPYIPDGYDLEIESVITINDQSVLNARRMIERRKELLELREVLDDPLFDMDFD